MGYGLILLFKEVIILWIFVSDNGFLKLVNFGMKKIFYTVEYLIDLKGFLG